MKRTFAEWDTKYVNDLPDSAFAYISSGGKKDSEGKTTPRSLRHLPYKDKDGKPDLPHVRNALARLDQTQIPESAKPAIKKKLEAILEKAKASNQYVGMFPFEFDEDADAEEDAQVAIPSAIHLIPIGQWDHDLYGPITIGMPDIREFVQNFNAGIRKGVYITAGHEGFQELPAVAWITKVEARDDGLWGTPEWNDLGTETLSDKQYKFFSPEFYRDYEDPQTHQIYRNVLTGGALTKSPYFKELQALVAHDKVCFSDRSINQFSDTTTMDLNELLAKDITTLSDEEKSFIKEHASELTDEQKTSHAAVIDEPADEVVETPEEKTAREAKEATDKEAANVAAGLNPDGSAKTVEPEIQASEKVMISASELAMLRTKADKGAEAFAELEKNRIATAVSTLMFSEGNREGRFLPKSTDSLRTFMESLNAAQRTSFATLVAELPTSKVLFSEIGAGGATDGTAEKEVEAKVNAKMSENKLSYSEALRLVMSENPALSERYEKEVNGIAA